jgi:hypothetical protein
VHPPSYSNVPWIRLDVELVKDVRRCREVVHRLLYEKDVGLDCEFETFTEHLPDKTVSIRKVALLQIYSHTDRTTYIFKQCEDGVDLLHDGHLNRFLQEPEIEKYVVGEEDYKLLRDQHQIKCANVTDLHGLATAVFSDVVPMLQDYFHLDEKLAFGGNTMGLAMGLRQPKFESFWDVKGRSDTIENMWSGIDNGSILADDKRQYAAYDAYAAYHVGHGLWRMRPSSESLANIPVSFDDARAIRSLK